MSTLTFPFWSLPAPSATVRDAVRSGPPPRPVPMPVFIQDAITPYRDETLLLARLRRDFEEMSDEGADQP